MFYEEKKNNSAVQHLYFLLTYIRDASLPCSHEPVYKLPGPKVMQYFREITTCNSKWLRSRCFQRRRIVAAVHPAAQAKDGFSRPQCLEAGVVSAMMMSRRDRTGRRVWREAGGNRSRVL